MLYVLIQLIELMDMVDLLLRSLGSII
ncbi:hypothetical protein LINPERPRIM_LOCUS40671 [Linum perenne]